MLQRDINIGEMIVSALTANDSDSTNDAGHQGAQSMRSHFMRSHFGYVNQPIKPAFQKIDRLLASPDLPKYVNWQDLKDSKGTPLCAAIRSIARSGATVASKLLKAGADPYATNPQTGMN